ncbi:hypothetical protein NDU88_010191 [Pleurodeles waltl]|uniref:Uncharacterized protein n=1 Tax=Pleurodeles waltl TaxID=8319 RepID=A0AAV7QVP3_PLEWA|nr:hypothetical protein NDU88_010191 [Pleurodeles waltl]
MPRQPLRSSETGDNTSDFEDGRKQNTRKKRQASCDTMNGDLDEGQETGLETPHPFVAPIAHLEREHDPVSSAMVAFKIGAGNMNEEAEL